MSNSEAHDAIYPNLERFARSVWHVRVPMTETTTPFMRGGEQADFAGWAQPKVCHIVDRKLSEGDCYAHLRKPHVEDPRQGMGSHRWILAPESMKRIPLPDGWGRLADNPKGEIWIVSEAEPFSDYQRNWAAENDLLVRALASLAHPQGHPKASNGQAKQSGLTGPTASIIDAIVESMGKCSAGDIRREQPTFPYKTSEALRKAMVNSGRYEHTVESGMTYFTGLTATAKGAA